MASFEKDFEALTGNPPFPWQRALFERLRDNVPPSVCDLPTGLGKTSVIALWLLALAARDNVARRLIYVVNRRTVVDQATVEAERLRKQLADHPELEHLRVSLSKLGALSSKLPLAISTLRGEFADNAEWRHDPTRAAVIVGTVDMVGSRLLFSGYGNGFKTRPLHAGFLGQDSLLVHDEAHLEPAFQQLLESVEREQRGMDRRPMKVMALSATSRSTGEAFSLSDADLKDATVRRRLYAGKRLVVREVADAKQIAEKATELALGREGKILVFLRTVEAVERCAAGLRKAVGTDKVEVLTGTLRGFERDGLVRNPVFARFLPRPPKDLTLSEGTVFLVCTSAGEVGVDISADHMVTDLAPFDSMAQRLGRLNRYGDTEALVDVIAEAGLAPPDDTNDPDAENDEDDGQTATREQYDLARYRTRVLLQTLPTDAEGRHDASPAALRALPVGERAAAFTPQPNIPAVDEMLFDRWAFTSIRAVLPGRPPVDEWLHGAAEWEPPRTTVAWRKEVEWLRENALTDGLEEFLSDYPLRPRERLSERSDRVLKHLKRLADDNHRQRHVWVLKEGVKREWTLAELIESQENQRNNGPLNDAVLILPPNVGGLSKGLLDGSAAFDEQTSYDLGCIDDPSRRVLEDGEERPAGMRLARVVRREASEEDDEPNHWCLYVKPAAAEDDGSRTARRDQELTEHLVATERWARALCEKLHLPAEIKSAIVRAARWHDLGKRRAVWQRSINNRSYPNVVLAKGRMRPSELSHYRHELGSLHDAENEPSFAGLDEDERELVLHLIAAHHGRARPNFPRAEALDPEVSDARVKATADRVPIRFERLQRKHGRWGLAWLESIVRAADYLASDDEEFPS